MGLCVPDPDVDQAVRKLDTLGANVLNGSGAYSTGNAREALQTPQLIPQCPLHGPVPTPPGLHADGYVPKNSRFPKQGKLYNHAVVL